MQDDKLEDAEKNTFEEALAKTGFGFYSYNITCLAGVVIISFACIFYNSTIVVPISACDLQTNGAQQGMLVAGPIVGSILGAMVWGYWADQHGRRRTLIISLLSGAAVNAVASFSLDWPMLLILQFIASLMISGQFSLAMTLLSESVPVDRRNLVVLLVTSIFLLSQGIMAGFGLYSYMHVSLTGFLIIAYAAIIFSNPLIIPTSACELGTTGAQQGMLAASPIVGSMIGGAPWGYLGDTRGRKITLIISLVCSALVNGLASLSVNWIMMMILQFVASILAGGQYSLSMTLLSESVPMAKRNLVVMLVTSIFILAQGIMAVIAMPIIPLSFSYYMPALGIYWNSWRTLMLIFSAPSIISAILLFFISESPKYTYTKGEEELTLEILRRIHRINSRFHKNKEELQVKGLQMLQQQESDKPTSAKEQFVPLVRAPLLKYMIIMTILFVFQQIGSLVVWFPTVANQFMESIGNDAPMNQTVCDVLRSSFESPPVPDPDAVPCSLNNTAMLIVLIVGVLQSVLSNLINLVLNVVGRRNMVIIVTAVCGLSGILMNLVPNMVASGVLYVVLLMGLVVLGLYTAIAVALFPTNLRVLAIGLTMAGARIGTIASVQVLNYLLVNNCDAGFYIFASMFGSSAIVASFLPDDRKLVQKPDSGRKKDEDSS